MKFTVALLQMATISSLIWPKESSSVDGPGSWGPTSLFSPRCGISVIHPFVPDFNGMEDDIWKAPALWSQSNTTTASSDLEQARLCWQSQAIKPDAPFVQHFQTL